MDSHEGHTTQLTTTLSIPIAPTPILVMEALPTVIPL